MKRIALLVPTFYYGGSKRSVSNIATVLSKHFETIVVQFDASENVYKSDSEIIDMKCPVRKHLISKVLNRLVRIIKYAFILKKRKVDISISFMDGANTVNYYTPSTCKKVISCRGFGDLLQLESRYVKMLRNIDGILFNSKAMHAYFVDKYPELKAKAFSVNNIYDEKMFYEYLNEETNESFNTFTATHKSIVCVGRASKEKGHTHLLKGFEILKTTVKNAGLIIIGDGPEFENIKKMVQQSAYEEDIMLLGYQKNPYKFVKKCDVATLTSINEGFPNVVVEALGCGLPVVCTNCKTGPNEILNAEFDSSLVVDKVYMSDYGILTPEFDPVIDYQYGKYQDSHKIFANALEKLLTNEQLRNRYRAAALKRFKDYTPESMLNNYVRIIEEMMVRD